MPGLLAEQFPVFAGQCGRRHIPSSQKTFRFTNFHPFLTSDCCFNVSLYLYENADRSIDSAVIFSDMDMSEQQLTSWPGSGWWKNFFLLFFLCVCDSQKHGILAALSYAAYQCSAHLYTQYSPKSSGSVRPDPAPHEVSLEKIENVQWQQRGRKGGKGSMGVRVPPEYLQRT